MVFEFFLIHHESVLLWCPPKQQDKDAPQHLASQHAHLRHSTALEQPNMPPQLSASFSLPEHCRMPCFSSTMVHYRVTRARAADRSMSQQ